MGKTNNSEYNYKLIHFFNKNVSIAITLLNVIALIVNFKRYILTVIIVKLKESKLVLNYYMTFCYLKPYIKRYEPSMR